MYCHPSQQVEQLTEPSDPELNNFSTIIQYKIWYTENMLILKCISSIISISPPVRLAFPPHCFVVLP